MAEIVLQGSGIVPIVGKFIAARMPQHVRMQRERHPGGLAEPLDKPVSGSSTGFGTKATLLVKSGRGRSPTHSMVARVPFGRPGLRQPGKNVPSGLLSSGVYLSLIAR